MARKEDDVNTSMIVMLHTSTNWEDTTSPEALKEAPLLIEGSLLSSTNPLVAFQSVWSAVIAVYTVCS